MSRTRVLLIALALAIVIGIAATIAGGLLVRGLGPTDCAPNPCVRYSDYGWPLEWRTNVPWRSIQQHEMDRGVWGYNWEGFSFGRFAADTLFFATPIVAAETAAFAVWWAWRRRGFLWRSSSA